MEVAYLAPNGDPLWFTVGKGSEDLIPTGNKLCVPYAISRLKFLILAVYALWKRSDLLPFLSTPAAVIPVLVGGADLMIPGGKCFAHKAHRKHRLTSLL